MYEAADDFLSSACVFGVEDKNNELKDSTFHFIENLLTEMMHKYASDDNLALKIKSPIKPFTLRDASAVAPWLFAK